MSAAGLILAAGASRRMGRPKALLELEGLSFLARGVALLRAAGCTQVVVVEGAHPLRALFERGGEGATQAGQAPLRWVHNPGWQRGPLSSLQVALAHALTWDDGGVQAIVVHHVERPRVQVETVRGLLAGLAGEPGTCWQPSYEGRSGHPLLLPRAACAALGQADPQGESLRTLLRSPAWAPLRRKLAVDDPGVLDNIDTPEDLARLV